MNKEKTSNKTVNDNFVALGAYPLAPKISARFIDPMSLAPSQSPSRITFKPNLSSSVNHFLIPS